MKKVVKYDSILSSDLSYHTNLGELDDIILRYVNDTKKFNFLVNLNDIGIPPAVSFICDTYLDNHDFYERIFIVSKNKDSNKKKFGRVIGDIFYLRGFTKEKSKHLKNSLVLFNASTFR